MNKQQAQDLIDKFNSGVASREEIRLLDRWYINESNLQSDKPENLDYLNIQKEMWVRILLLKIKKKKLFWLRPTAAAALFISFSIGIYLLFPTKLTNRSEPEQGSNLFPGSNKAVLTLSDGQQILLSAAKRGQIASQGSALVNLVDDGKIKYNANPLKGEVAPRAIIYNKITTPRAGQYTVILADGTQVWLNAESSIRYPTTFLGQDREVELSGEAYFEVAKNRKKPFRVLVGKQVVEVLGTHFNINSYPNENYIKTDLLEGKVKITTGKDSVFLKPGQESVFMTRGSTLLVKQADTYKAVAWKNGLFNFEKAELPQVMRELARWYDLEVYYQGKVPSTAITGTVDRNVNAAQFFRILKDLDIKFKIEGKKITIMQ